MILSPCNGICRLDAAGRFCVGCLRTVDEVVGWGAMTEDQRRSVVERLQRERLAADLQLQPTQ